uniref:Uncharacterized protein n=1 Tax=Rangifer tarandus platyrhynchus TaxID=3082113 RepID=A0ACB0F6X1_RANTA|nr:unnamed protein product [Rangifer tarandus platyrhynchus]
MCPGGGRRVAEAKYWPLPTDGARGHRPSRRWRPQNRYLCYVLGLPLVWGAEELGYTRPHLRVNRAQIHFPPQGAENIQGPTEHPGTLENIRGPSRTSGASDLISREEGNMNRGCTRGPSCGGSALAPETLGPAAGEGRALRGHQGHGCGAGRAESTSGRACGQRRLAGCRARGCEESDSTRHAHAHLQAEPAGRLTGSGSTAVGLECPRVTAPRLAPLHTCSPSASTGCARELGLRPGRAPRDSSAEPLVRRGSRRGGGEEAGERRGQVAGGRLTRPAPGEPLTAPAGPLRQRPGSLEEAQQQGRERRAVRRRRLGAGALAEGEQGSAEAGRPGLASLEGRRH